MKVSVALCTYNGELYIEDQILSILPQIKETDELVISDDNSCDDTIKIIEKYCEKYKNIKLIKGPKKGFVKNFENVITYCTGDIIFLSDQDDIWEIDKVRIISELLKENPKVDVVLHNMSLIDGDGIVTGLNYLNYKKGFFLNLFKSSYYGCCMCIRKKYIDRYLPFNRFVIAHDQYLSLFSEWKKTSAFINLDLIKHRVHSSNVSKKSNFFSKVTFRINIFLSFFIGKRKWNDGK